MNAKQVGMSIATEIFVRMVADLATDYSAPGTNADEAFFFVNQFREEETIKAADWALRAERIFNAAKLDDDGGPAFSVAAVQAHPYHRSIVDTLKEEIATLKLERASPVKVDPRVIEALETGLAQLPTISSTFREALALVEASEPGEFSPTLRCEHVFGHPLSDIPNQCTKCGEVKP